MIEELKNQIDELFEAAPKTRAAYELKEELLANSTERYRDLTAENIPEREALDIVINSIGDINQLFVKEHQEQAYLAGQLFKAEAVKKAALLKAVGTGMYIMGFCLMMITMHFFSSPLLSWGVLIMTAAVATGILVYANAAYPKYQRGDDTMVEEFREWNSSRQIKKTFRQSVTIIVWMLILTTYFLLSFATGAWYITWIIFLIGICAHAVVNLVFQIRE